jgi:hypothetical protein
LRRHDTYHIEGDNIAEGDLARLVSLDEKAINDFRAATGGQTQHKRLLWCRVEGFDSALFLLIPSSSRTLVAITRKFRGKGQ